MSHQFCLVPASDSFLQTSLMWNLDWLKFSNQTGPYSLMQNLPLRQEFSSTWMTENIHRHCVMLEEQLYEIKLVFVSYTLKLLSQMTTIIVYMLL